MKRILIFLICALSQASFPAQLQADDTGDSQGSIPRQFFRLQSPEAAGITLELKPGGWLEWESPLPGGTYLIERSYELSGDDWEPVTRGVATAGRMVVKVFDPEPPSGMRFIPGGMFTMGDILGDLNNATPVHPVSVSPFFMQSREVTVAQLTELLQWGHERELLKLSADGKMVLDLRDTPLMEIGQHNSQILFGPEGFAVKAGHDDFPAPYVSWYGAVTCSNFMSSLHGLETCYDLETWTCDFEKVGYRLPTEAEWELAARGGHEGTRFPWSDVNTITHGKANYKAGPKPGSTETPPYDLNPTPGLHPDYAANRPPSSPVGVFAPNNYGLYDMCGNVWEWVWDWSARYTSGLQHDPTGPVTGTFAIFRGGSWQTTAERDTVATRYRSATRASTIEDVGFRMVIPSREAAPPGEGE